MTDAPPREGDAGRIQSALQAVAPDEQWPKGLLLAAYSSPRLAFETLKLMHPELVQYRGGWFRSDGFRSDYVDGFFEQTQGHLPSVEFVVNHLHIDEMLFGQKEPMPPEVAYAICQMLAFGWRNWACERYGITIRPSIAHSDEGYEVSFRSVSEDEGATA